MKLPWHTQSDFPWAFSDAGDVPVGECYGSSNNGKRAREHADHVVRCVNEYEALKERIRDLEAQVESLQDRWASRPLSSEDQAVRLAALEASVADAIDVLKIFSQDAAMLGYVDAAGWEQFDRLMQRLRKVETSAPMENCDGKG